MNDGLLGIGYAHAMPPPRTPSVSNLVTNRWREVWEPKCVLATKRISNHDAATVFDQLRVAYQRRMDRLLTANISWNVIIAGDLDSPFTTGTEFDRALCLAIERRRCRLGRRAGKGKKYANGK